MWPVRRRSHVDGGSLPRLRVVVAAGLVFISMIIRSEAMDGERKFAGGWWSDTCWLVWMVERARAAAISNWLMDHQCGVVAHGWRWTEDGQVETEPFCLGWFDQIWVRLHSFDLWKDCVGGCVAFLWREAKVGRLPAIARPRRRSKTASALMRWANEGLGWNYLVGFDLFVLRVANWVWVLLGLTWFVFSVFVCCFSWLGFSGFWFWLGLISLSSFERGLGCFGLVGVLLWWRHTWGLWFISVLAGCQHVGGLPLHVVWWSLDTVLKKDNWLGLLLVTRLYRDSQALVAHVERQIWLGVGPFRLMDVAFSDGPVTMDLVRNVCCGVGIITDRSIVL